MKGGAFDKSRPYFAHPAPFRQRVVHIHPLAYHGNVNASLRNPRETAPRIAITSLVPPLTGL